MSSDRDYIRFVAKAQKGNRQALNDLTRAVRVPLSEYVQRLTLNEDLTQDLVQETLLAMVRQFKSLRDPEAFWPWLSYIALNKVRTHYRSDWRRQKNRRQSPPSHAFSQSVQDTVGEAIENEVRQIIVSALHQLSPEHRAAITLRCYEQLTFEEMAAQLGYSEFKTRSLFHRARKALGRNLTSSGLGKGSLIGALILFGKMSARSEAAVTQVAITQATLRTGCGAVVAAMFAGHAACMMSTLVLGALAAGLMLISSGSMNLSSQDPALGLSSLEPDRHQRIYYYYPRAYPDTVLIRTRDTQADDARSWQCVQDEHGCYVRRGNEVHLCDAHLWRSDLLVFRLPTDSPTLRGFLDQVEGCATPTKRVKPSHGSLLVVQGSNEGEPDQQTIANFDPTDEEFFIHPWPSELSVVDKRDALHKQGWCYFRVSGQLGGHTVQGSGCLPLAPVHVTDHGPGLRLSVGDTLVLVDGSTGAWVSHSGQGIVARHRPGSFFEGLSRPWMGLHTVDTIRRDAARFRLPFETKADEAGDQTYVTVSIADGHWRFDYQIDMAHDLLQAISCFRNGVPAGHIRIEYSESLEPGESSLDRSVSKPPSGRQRTGPNRWWLTEVLDGTWAAKETNDN